MVKNVILNLLITFCYVALLCTTHATGQNISASSAKVIEQKITRLEDEWLSTYVSGDKTKYDEIVDDDFTGIDESAVLRMKAEDRALLPAASVPGGSAANEDVRVRVYGKFAVATGRIVTRFVADGREIAGFRTRFTDTWIEKDGVWKVIARHYSRYPMQRVAAKVDPTALSELAGKYAVAPGLMYEVAFENGKLFGLVAGQPKLELLPESEFVFFTNAPPVLYFFTRDRSGKIAQIVFIQDGRVTAAKKT